MRKAKDLTGLIFGKLTVLERDWNYVKENNLKCVAPYWKCKCSCGNIITIRGDKLTRKENNAISCLNCRKEKTIRAGQINNLVGQKFSHLTVLELTEKRVRGYIVYKCLCDCGNIVEAVGHDLINERKKSCGCSKGESFRSDLTNQRFGKLIALEIVKRPEEAKRKQCYWRCKCDCGNYKIVGASNLVKGVTQSCGCLYSKGEEKISKILKNNNIPFQQQKTFDNCRYIDTNKLARFDFYVNNSFLLEFDGKQHYSYTDQGWNTKEHYEKTKEHDNYKNNWCKENRITLKRIPYWDLDKFTIEDIMGDKYNVNE